jgi:hypothetical protein
MNREADVEGAPLALELRDEEREAIAEVLADLLVNALDDAAAAGDSP